MAIDWIKTEDRLPPNDDYVPVWFEERKEWDRGCWCEGRWLDTWLNPMVAIVTHWADVEGPE